MCVFTCVDGNRMRNIVTCYCIVNHIEHWCTPAVHYLVEHVSRKFKRCTRYRFRKYCVCIVQHIPEIHLTFPQLKGRGKTIKIKYFILNVLQLGFRHTPQQFQTCKKPTSLRVPPRGRSNVGHSTLKHYAINQLMNAIYKSSRFSTW